VVFLHPNFVWWEERVKDIYRWVLDDLAVVSPQIGVGFVVFIIASFVGALNPQVGGAAVQVFAAYVEDLVELGTVELIIQIFLRNASTAVASIMGGVLFGILPLLSIIFNGILLGAMLRLVTWDIWRIIPHGIFELPAMFIAWGLGLWVGAWILEPPRWENLKTRVTKGLVIYLFLILPLLAIAAVIEGIAAGIYRG
jgi:stage II sporulation protein M